MLPGRRWTADYDDTLLMLKSFKYNSTECVLLMQVGRVPKRHRNHPLLMLLLLLLLLLFTLQSFGRARACPS